MVTLAALGTWWLFERLVRCMGRALQQTGRRGNADRALGGLALGSITLSLALMLGSLVGLILWSLAAYWPFPHAVPQPITLHNWLSAMDGVTTPLVNAAVIGLVSTLLSLLLVIGALENETLRKRPMRPWAQLVLYLPLLVPPIAFLFGMVMLQAQLGIAPGLAVVIFGHAVFVLPYVFLSLAESYRRLDPRWAQVARSLGARPSRVFALTRLPMLSVPLLTAAAVGFAVSIGQYLPTLLLGAGRVSTITTDAISLASGGNRRLTAVYALLQLALPALGFALALGLPRLLFRRRSAMRTPT
ncbi:MAG: ABC transporter permease subunit [Luteimonas sp.]|nr:ABC transporter permease subunit [Luteimonas sp.]